MSAKRPNSSAVNGVADGETFRDIAEKREGSANADGGASGFAGWRVTEKVERASMLQAMHAGVINIDDMTVALRIARVILRRVAVPTAPLRRPHN